MKSKIRSKGTGWHRFTVRLLTSVLVVLFYWLLGFFVEDLRTMEGPDLAEVEEGFVDQELVASAASLQEQIADLDRDIRNESAKQKVVGDGSRNLQQTITQLLELQKLSFEKGVSVSEDEQNNLNSTLNLFLENQREYQSLSQSSTGFLSQRQALAAELEQVQEALKNQREPAREAFNERWQSHRLRLAFWQLAVLIPILAAAAFLLVKRRGSLYFPFYLALGLAAVTKVTLVVHEYFPSRYFKYILIGVLLLVVGKILAYFIRQTAYPKTEWLVKQYREAYERFLCPICDYPIRTGPRRFLFWTRRTVAKLPVPADESQQEETYTCPSCGSGLFSECPSCHRVRHRLLPHCQFCGEKQDIVDANAGESPG